MLVAISQWWNRQIPSPTNPHKDRYRGELGHNAESDQRQQRHII
jgi:hypothetical protein